MHAASASTNCMLHPHVAHRESRSKTDPGAEKTLRAGEPIAPANTRHAGSPSLPCRPSFCFSLSAPGQADLRNFSPVWTRGHGLAYRVDYRVELFWVDRDTMKHLRAASSPAGLRGFNLLRRPSARARLLCFYYGGLPKIHHRGFRFRRFPYHQIFGFPGHDLIDAFSRCGATAPALRRSRWSSKLNDGLKKNAVGSDCPRIRLVWRYLLSLIVAIQRHISYLTILIFCPDTAG
jgi:hypothetical protein